MKKKVKRYSEDFKFKVVQEYLNQDVSKEELQIKYGIRGSSIILYWIRKFGLESMNEHQLETDCSMKANLKKSSTEIDLENENQKLKQLLEHERLRTLSLNTMIDIAERDLKIQIRKKSGAKQ
ncbi:MAG: transposase [Bacteroidota bacterium]